MNEKQISTPYGTIHYWTNCFEVERKTLVFLPGLTTTHAEYELQYKGAKEMLLVDDVDNKEFLAGLFNSIYDELPTPKPKKKK